MKAFRAGYIVSVSFLLILAVAFLTTGFYPLPEGPKAPKYPSYPTAAALSPGAGSLQRAAQSVLNPETPQDDVAVALPVTGAPLPAPSGSNFFPTPTPYVDYNYNNTYDNSYNEKMVQYQKDLDKYETDMEKYKKDQKTFMQDKIVPYIRNIYVAWIILLVAAEVLAVLMVSKGMELAGGALAFTGIWAVVFGPIWGGMLMLSSAVSALAAVATTSGQTFSMDTITRSAGIASLVGSAVLLVAGALYEMKFRRPAAS